MPTKAILTCFVNDHCGSFEFPIPYARADARTVFAYLLNHTHIRPENIYLFTDMEISHDVCQRLYMLFYTRAAQIFQRYFTLPPPPLPPSLEKISPRAGYYLLCAYARIMHTTVRKVAKFFRKAFTLCIAPIQILEYIYLFAHLRLIHTRDEYIEGVRTLFQSCTRHDRLFWYYSGHGVINFKGVPACGVLIPEGQRKECVLFSTEELSRLFFSLLPSLEIVAVFDCCHAAAMLALPSRKNFLFIASSRREESSGFYSGEDGFGSIFTLKYLRHLSREGDRDLPHAFTSISQDINTYRQRFGKPPQHISYTCVDKPMLPKWLCDRFGKEAKIFLT